MRRLSAALLLVAACGGPRPPALPGETPEYEAWRAHAAGTEVVGSITGGAGTLKCVVELQGFPVSKEPGSWVEVEVNRVRAQRFSLHSPDGRPLALRHERPIPHGAVQVRVFYTASNRGGSVTGTTTQGTHFIITPGGDEGVTITQQTLR